MNEAPNPEMLAERSTLKDQLEIFKFLRAESEASRSALRDEAEAARKLLLDTVKWVSVPLAVALAVSGIFLFRDLDTFKQRLHDEAEAEAKNEIRKMDQQMDDTLQQGKAEAKNEINGMKNQIDETLKTQFGTEKIQATISKAAEDATREQAPRLIKEVIAPEVTKAVDRQSGTIKDLANAAATERVKSTIDPIAAGLQVQELVTEARADDAKAFDKLLDIERTGSASQRELVRGVMADIDRNLRDQEGLGSWGECTDPSTPESLARLNSSVAQTRQKALQDCADWVEQEPYGQMVHGSLVRPFPIEEQIIPLLTKAALSDSSLRVRAVSIKTVNGLLQFYPRFPQGVGLLDSGPLREWWDGNSSPSNYRATLLISRARANRENADLKYLYDRISTLDTPAVGPLKKDVADALAYMREQAARRMLTPAQLNEVFRRENCETVTKEFGELLSSGLEQADTNFAAALFEPQFLVSCPISPQYIHGLVEIATKNEHLSARYAATLLINKWCGANLDAFDEAVIQAWWAKHALQYQGQL